MKIQIIGKTNRINKDDNIRLSTLQEPLALDLFDINVINLGYEGLWKNNGTRLDKINELNDLCSVNTMIQNANAPVIIVFPQNYTFSYHYGYSSFSNHKKLKDMIPDLLKIVSVLLPEFSNSLLFENNVTCIEELQFMSAFCFTDYASDDPNIITTSRRSNKPTTVRIDEKILLTTLDICESNELLMGFVNWIYEKSNKKELVPPWIDDVEFYNDQDAKKIIDTQKTIINEAERIIIEAEKQLNKNNRFKSILYTNGEELVKVVFDIIEEMLSCDLSDFVDDNREDFLIKLQNVTFIGEIKGVSSNVKNENVSQLDVHFQHYQDELQEKGLQEDTKALLIINPLRFLPLGERERVNDSQVNLAKRNGSLIIETSTLLILYEKFLKKEISTETIISLLKDNTGLLKYEN